MTSGSYSGQLLAASAPFPGEDPAVTLRNIPSAPGVFALYGLPAADGASTQPYLSRAADLRRRIARLLAPPELAADGTPVRSKRLNLRERVARIEYTATGSEWESVLVLYRAARAAFGPDEARRRLRLHTPYFVRFAYENAFPRLYVTNRLSRRALETTYGPFPSRAAAERYADAILDLFKLRRCHEELTPAADHPGCIYGEMNKCLRPCQRAHEAAAAEAYSVEAAAVRGFLDTRGESLAGAIGTEREAASAAMEFERAAELHKEWQKVRAVQALADELTQPVPKLRALIVQHAAAQGTATAEQGSAIAQGTATAEQGSATAQASSTAEQGSALPQGSTAPDPNTPEPSASYVISEDTNQRAALYLVAAGCIHGPALLSTLGVRAVREQTAVGSSLFAQPLMLQAVPLADPESAAPPPSATPAESPEARATNAIAALVGLAVNSPAPDMPTLSDYLSMVRRWYYRPEKQRAGEVFFPLAEESLPDANGVWPIRRILNGAARVALGTPARMADTQRELAERNRSDAAERPARTKVLHAGRPDVERVVPVVGKPAPFRSRRSKPEQESG